MSVEGNMTASDHIGVVDVLKTVAEKYSGKNIFSQSFEDVVQDVKLVERFKDLICTTRSTHLNYESASKAKEELTSFANSLFYGNRYGGKTDKIKFSVPQKISLYSLSRKVLFSGVSSEDYLERYPSISKNRARLEEFHKNLIEFNYSDYGVSKKEVLAKIKDKYDTAINTINVYEAVCNEAGNDLVNWSQHKISRRLNKETVSISSWLLNRFINEMKESLLNKGAEIVAPKSKKIARGIELYKKHKLGDELTQEEVMTVLKQTDHTIEMINLMTLETIYEVMDSKLKVVANKLVSAYGNRYSMLTGGSELINRAIEIAPITKENFQRIRTYSEIKCNQQLPWEYIYKNSDFINTDYVVSKIEKSSMPEVPSDFYDKHLAHLDNKDLLKQCYTVTKEFVRRLSEEDKIGLLPRLGNKYIHDTKDNSINFINHFDWWDYVKSTRFDEKDLYDLYKDVSWEAIKPTVLELTSLRRNAVELAVLNKDKESALTILKESGKSLDVDKKFKLLSMFDNRARVKIVLESALAGQNYLIDTFQQSLEYSDLLSLFSGIIGKSDAGFLDAILEYAKKQKMDISAFKNIILTCKELNTLPVSYTMNKFLDNETKIHLLNVGCELAVHKSYSYHGQRTEGLHPILNEFFSTLKRKELVEIFGENLVESPYRLYMCHAMTPNERGIASEDKLFLRVHVQQIPYTYLQKYQDKKLFKELVGDRRDRSNNNFALCLEHKFQEELKTKINPANSIKLMFA